MASRGVMADLMKRLVKTYHETGGDKWKDEDLDEDVQGLSPFDAQKLLLAKKIQSTRKKIKERDDHQQRKKATNNKVMRLNNEIRQMVKILKSDHNKLLDQQRRTAKRRAFLSQKKKQVLRDLALRQQEDCELIYCHIVEVEELDKRRHQKKGRGKKGRDADRDSLLDEGEMEIGQSAVDDGPGMRQVMLETQLPDSATESNLPEIDISDSLLKVDDLKAKLDQGLDEISKKLDVLKNMSKTMGDELDVQNIMLKDLDGKVDVSAAMLEKLNDKVKKAQNETNNITIFIVIIIILIILIIIVIVAFVLFKQFLRPALPTFKFN